jgi:hypothetical protein
MLWTDRSILIAHLLLEAVVLFYVLGLLVLVAWFRVLTWVRKAWRSIDWSRAGRGGVLTWNNDGL